MPGAFGRFGRKRYLRSISLNHDNYARKRARYNAKHGNLSSILPLGFMAMFGLVLVKIGFDPGSGIQPMPIIGLLGIVLAAPFALLVYYVVKLLIGNDA